LLLRSLRVKRFYLITFHDPVIVLFDVYEQNITILLLKVNSVLIYCPNLTRMKSLVSLFWCEGRACEVAG
jgi:hypothetical protein